MMEIPQSGNDSDGEIRTLLIGIQNLTVQMSNTFQQAILRHQEQFIKTYRVKVCELTKLFEQLTRVLEDKFINNALTNRLQIVMKERDYFKYQCLKLNVQYQTALNEQNSLNCQLVNITDQMKIYKHLLEDEKLRNKELEKNAQKFKTNFSSMAYKNLTDQSQHLPNRIKNPIDDPQDRKNKKIDILQNQLKEKNDQLRILKGKISEIEGTIMDREHAFIEKKQMYEIFKGCVNSWKRQILTKERKQNLSKTCSSSKGGWWTIDKESTQSKKQLLKGFFTSPQFLFLIEKLLFQPKFRVQFVEKDEESENLAKENRSKLMAYMKKKKI